MYFTQNDLHIHIYLNKETFKSNLIENSTSSENHSLISVPSLPPTAVVATGTSGFTSNIEWKHIPSDKWNGKPVGTLIKYNSNEGHRGNLTVPYPATSYIITGLKPVTTYKIMVCEVTRPGHGPCQQTKATTLPSRKY